MEFLWLLTPTLLVTPSGNFSLGIFFIFLLLPWSIYCKIETSCCHIKKGIMMLKVRGGEVWRSFTKQIILAKPLTLLGGWERNTGSWTEPRWVFGNAVSFSMSLSMRVILTWTSLRSNICFRQLKPSEKITLMKTGSIWPVLSMVKFYNILKPFVLPFCNDFFFGVCMWTRSWESSSPLFIWWASSMGCCWWYISSGMCFWWVYCSPQGNI